MALKQGAEFVSGCLPTGVTTQKKGYAGCLLCLEIGALMLGCGSGNHPVLPPTAPAGAPNAMTFAAVRGTQSSAQAVSITRYAGDAITSKLATGAPFVILSGGLCVEGTPTCQIKLAFAPSAPGSFHDSLVLTDTKTGLVGTVPLTGLPIYTPPLATAASLLFGEEEIGLTSSAQWVGFSAQDQDAVTVAVQPALHYSLTADAKCAQGAPSCQIGVAFHPLQDGAIAGNLLVTDTATGASATVPLSGTGYGIAGAMAGLDYYLPFTDNSGATVSDVSGNHRDRVLSGPGKVAAWVGGVGLAPNDQLITIPDASAGRHEVCALIFPRCRLAIRTTITFTPTRWERSPGRRSTRFTGREIRVTAPMQTSPQSAFRMELRRRVLSKASRVSIARRRL